jgi:hypothetical protein
MVMDHHGRNPVNEGTGVIFNSIKPIVTSLLELQEVLSGT